MTLSYTPDLIIATSGLEPFLQAYVDSDLIGRMIYISLFMLSFISWAVLIYKWWITQKIRNESYLFKKAFFDQKQHPLQITFQNTSSSETPNAFFMIYNVLKSKAIDFMKKNEEAQNQNRQMSEIEITNVGSLVINDFSILEAQASSIITSVTKYLERNLYILSTIVTLAPFLGLLGTVYGILVTFSGLGPDTGTGASGGSTQQILSGLSLALTTTVVGLMNAIPALIGYNFLKNNILDFEHEMERFATEVLSIFDAQYRQRTP